MADMEKRTPEQKGGFEPVPFRIHPRVFAALGEDLVTNDVVAVIELVKNSYDAFAHSVRLKFRDDPIEGAYLEIEDDGAGMTREVIENVWCVVATPYKQKHPVVKSDKKERRVAGEKGLGRLSAARLGQRLHMLTKAPGNPCWEIMVDWSNIAESDDMSNSFATCRKYSGDSPFRSGTRLRVHGLREQWGESRISDLAENLGRLISPFSVLDDFNIFLSVFDDAGEEDVKIESPEFLSQPKYSIRGSVDDSGNVSATYKFFPIAEGDQREKYLTLPWERIHNDIQNRARFQYSSDRTHCGKFSFEIRAWDIAPDDTKEIAERFNFQQTRVRKSIRAHKGISVYRDNILVLPKSDNARDWLGLDLRRVSKVGTRLSTSQIVGYVAISAEDNPRIK